MVVEGSENKNIQDAKEALVTGKNSSSARASQNRVNSTIKSLMIFRLRFFRLPFCQLLSVFGDALKQTVSIAGGMMGNSLLNSVAYFSLNRLGDSLHQASFGLISAYYYTFCFGLVLSSLDKIGINLSAAFGKRDYAAFKKVKQQGMLCTAGVIAVVSLPMFIFSGDVLLAIDVAEENAEVAQENLRLLIGVLVLQVCSDMTRTICISQGLESYFAKVGALNITVCFFLTYVLVFEYQLSIIGWVLCRYLYEFTNLSVGLYTYFFHTHPDTKGFVSFRESLKGLWSFFLDNLNYTLTSYCEFFAYQTTTYFVALTHDNNQLAGFSAVYNWGGVVYTLGISMSSICRTRMNLLVGSGNPIAARNYFEFYYLCSLFVGVAVGCITYFIREPLSWIYADSNPEMKDWYKLLLAVYCLAIPNDASYYVVMLGMKSLNRVAWLVVMSIATVVVGNVLVCRYLYTLEAQSQYYLLSMTLFFFLLNISCYLIALGSDWKKLTQTDTVLAEDGKDRQTLDAPKDGRIDLDK